MQTSVQNFQPLEPLSHKHLQPYYTTSPHIVRYMASMLDVRPAMHVMEPCAGEGALIDAVISHYPDVAIQIDAFDINPDAIALLRKKYLHQSFVRVTERDILLDTELQWCAMSGGRYDRIIANPPFGAWQSPERRKQLKKLFPDFYVKDSYTLFLILALRLLREGGKMVFIIPDTFLSLTTHKHVRATLLQEAKISEIVLFPSSFFPNISFGYANLCLITIEKCDDQHHCMANSVRIIQGLRTVNDLSELARFERLYPQHMKSQEYSQQELYANSEHRIFCAEDTRVHRYFQGTRQFSVSDIADCVTGFYSGNDKLFLRRSPDCQKGNRYEAVEEYNTITEQEQQEQIDTIMNGFDGQRHFLPFVKGGNTRYHKPTMWYMNWSKQAIQEYRTSKKARLQNTSYYFREGLAVPMVSSSSITAALLQKRLFDQSIVGVFLHQGSLEMLRYLLAFFNSPVCNILIRAINRTANNSANYIKQIPLIIPSDAVLSDISVTVGDILEECSRHNSYSQAKEQHIHRIINELYDI